MQQPGKKKQTHEAATKRTQGGKKNDKNKIKQTKITKLKNER